MDLEQALEEKRQLEKSIEKLIADYENRTHTKVVDIGMQPVRAPDPTVANQFVTIALSLRVGAET